MPWDWVGAKLPPPNSKRLSTRAVGRMQVTLVAVFVFLKARNKHAPITLACTISYSLEPQDLRAPWRTNVTKGSVGPCALKRPLGFNNDSDLDVVFVHPLNA